ncbi:hypothetical protein Bca4012_089661 [Brassica carinata]
MMLYNGKLEVVPVSDGSAAWETVKEKTHNIEEEKGLAGSSKIRLKLHQSGSNMSNHLSLNSEKKLSFSFVNSFSFQPNTFFSFVSREPSIEVSASDASVFGTGWPDDANEECHIVSDRKERRKWSPTEDKVLISAWLNTSKDPVVGNEQKAIVFWKRIAAYFGSSPQLAALQKREPSHCKQRWEKINEGVCKFIGCYDAATKQKSSGQSENDVLKMAHEIFFNDYKSKFTLEHGYSTVEDMTFLNRGISLNLVDSVETEIQVKCWPSLLWPISAIFGQEDNL